ncbi:hypothetical protein ACKKBF_B09965 [Auxenochlorella protothecoides x Auxenochlorella symbiontica]
MPDHSACGGPDAEMGRRPKNRIVPSPKAAAAWRITRRATTVLMVAGLLIPLAYHFLVGAGLPRPASAAPAAHSAAPQVFRYRIVSEHWHDPKAFTQGLEYGRTCSKEGNCTDFFWESTGMYGESEVRQVEFASGRVLRSRALPSQDFAEGITKLGNSLYQLTWRSPRAWVYATEDLGAARLASTPLLDGWGITNDGTRLILGDSSPTLTWVDPGTMARLHQRSVQDAGRAVPFLNELEWVDGAILANIWGRECLVRVNPADGRVLAWVDLRGITAHMAGSLSAEERKGPRLDVLNGVAWDAQGRRLFVTGKRWPRLYRIELVPVPPEHRGSLLADLREACIVVDTSIFGGRR